MSNQIIGSVVEEQRALVGQASCLSQQIKQLNGLDRQDACPTSQPGRRVTRLLLTFLCAFIAIGSHAATISVETTKPGASISPMMWGIFFEDINFGADGGLHAELVKNGSFDFANPTMGWQALGKDSLRIDAPLNSVSPRYLVLAPNNVVVNEGFRGIGVKDGERYEFSVKARSASVKSVLRIQLVSRGGAVLGSTELKHFTPDWKTHRVSIKANATDPKAQLQLANESIGELQLDFISLMPKRTWDGQANMLRADMVQLLADLKPGFMRFPGGCIVEGRTLPLRYQWKNTIGPVEERPLLINRWNDEFKHRPAPDYFQSFRLGFYEYFLLCEDIGAEPLPILNCGMACQFNTGQLVPMDQLDPYIQDALDLIEFANGARNTPWGSKRAAMGHPKPFNMKVLGIGNEQWGPQYIERYAAFAKVLKARHPEIKLVSSAGPGIANDKFDFLWPKLRELNADIVDEHNYANPKWFFDHATHYDKYDRNGPKVFMGEYAAQSVKVVSPENRNTLECALAEAAFMTGLERNADVVVMTSYAPLSAHVDAWQWTPNLIWFDNLRSVATPNYYVQQLFSRNRGDRILPITLANDSAPLYSSAVLDEKGNEAIIKVVNPHAEAIVAEVDLKGSEAKRGELTVLSGDKLSAENTLDQPTTVIPVKQKIAISGDKFSQSFAPRSISVLRVALRK